jgi:putative exosortase-associated protein (TIGR04073 family)
MHIHDKTPPRLRWFVSASALALVLVGAAPAAAQTAQDKFARGFAGMTTGFLEVPGNMVAETDARGPAEGMPLGFAKGLGMIVVRELVSVWEFVSAPFPVPAGYRPVIQPEYPWGYFNGERPSELGKRQGGTSS